MDLDLCRLLFLLLNKMLVHPGSSKIIDGWVKTPGIVRVCTGDNASLEWVYNQTLGTPRGVTVARSDLVITLVSKLGTQPPESHRPRATFIENAGVRVTQITSGDAGKYESTVFFSPGNSLSNEATLITYEDCPDRQEFRNPEIDIVYSIPQDSDRLNLQTSLADYLIHLRVKVPKGVPKVNCSLYIDTDKFDCESGDASISTDKEKSLNVTVKLSHEALGDAYKTVIFNRTLENRATDPPYATLVHIFSQEQTTTSGGKYEGYERKAGFSWSTLTAILGCLLLVSWTTILIMSLYVRSSRKRKRVNSELVAPGTNETSLHTPIEEGTRGQTIGENPLIVPVQPEDEVQSEIPEKFSEEKSPLVHAKGAVPGTRAVIKETAPAHSKIDSTALRHSKEDARAK